MRSALTLKLLTSCRTGAIAAAATFALPETVGGERNWDYRFTWIRDASLTAATLTRLGFKDEICSYMGWIRQRYAEAAADGMLQIMYGIDGRHELVEETLPHLEGYMKSAPVRIYNGAYKQLQIDIYGELMLAVDAYDQSCQQVSHDLWDDLTHSINWVCANWERRDEGVWEVRGGAQEFLYSRLMSWTAVDRALRIADRHSLPAPVQHWRETRDAIYREIFGAFWDSDQSIFVQYKGSNTLDAACLLMPIVGFVGPQDPRWLSTLNAISEQLTDDSLVYRYRVGQAATDGLVGAEGTFNMCSFWHIQCLALAGDLKRAQLFFEKIHGFANHLGLYAEEMGLRGEQLGNFPQAFTHLGLIDAAIALDGALSEAAGAEPSAAGLTMAGAT
jgi:GH15 family glucan-1,4-alpha-glucosidase